MARFSRTVVATMAVVSVIGVEGLEMFPWNRNPNRNQVVPVNERNEPVEEAKGGNNVDNNGVFDRLGRGFRGLFRRPGPSEDALQTRVTVLNGQNNQQNGPIVPRDEDSDEPEPSDGGHVTSDDEEVYYDPHGDESTMDNTIV
jgi:hypothetical protein